MVHSYVEAKEENSDFKNQPQIAGAKVDVLHLSLCEAGVASGRPPRGRRGLQLLDRFPPVRVQPVRGG